MGELKQASKKRGQSAEHMLKIGKGTRWQKGRSGNPLGRMPENPVSERLKKILSNPKTLKRYAEAAVKKAIEGNPKFWEMVADRVEGKVPQQVDLQASILHSVTDLDRVNAQKDIEAIIAYESEEENPIAGELVEENEVK